MKKGVSLDMELPFPEVGLFSHGIKPLLSDIIFCHCILKKNKRNHAPI